MPDAAGVIVMRFRQDGRSAIVRRTRNPLGPELRCEVDGAFVWSRTFGSDAELHAELDRVRDDFLSRGWLSGGNLGRVRVTVE